jgi:hypothetical protein
MNSIRRVSTFIVLPMLFSGVTDAVHAQALTPSGPAQGKTCSQLAGECVSFNQTGGFDSSRCAGYKASCMKTGTYVDKKRTVTGVTKQ